MTNPNDLSFNPLKALANFTLKDTPLASPEAIIERIDLPKTMINLENLDDLLSVSGMGPLDSAVTANFWGTRRSGNPGLLPVPKENTGLTFFTRPRLNLSDSNIAANILSLLANENPRSIARAIRAFLDPYTGGTPAAPTATTLKGLNPTIYKSDLVDPLNPFITILGNNVASSSGYPDTDLNQYTSPEGVMKEQWGMIDDVCTLFGKYELNFTFKNMYGDPLGTMLYLWLFYMSSVYMGDIYPHIDSIVDNEIDYQTRIYRFVLDPTRTRVLKMFCTGASYPTATNTGASFNQSEGKPYTDEMNLQSVSFSCFGAVYYDPRIIFWFNKTVEQFNPNMVDGKRQATYVQIPFSKYVSMDNMGYPRINPENMDMEWWISPQIYQELLARGY